MLNHSECRLAVFEQQSWKFSVPVGAALALAITLGAASARAQECESDADCGFGFRCHQEVISTTTSDGSSVTTVGTTGLPAEPVCGDSICAEVEDPEICPEDCGIFGYCVGASCESSSECAEDYSCQPAGGVFSTTTTGSDGPLCGDLTCEDPESEDSCATDCSTERTCQETRCETDADCEDGFYCDPRGGSAVSSVGGSSGGSGGTSATLELYQSACLPLPTDGAGGNGSGVSGSTVETSVASDSSSGSNGTRGEHPGHQPPWPHGPHWGCAVARASSSGSPFLPALAALFACGVVQRRRRNV